MKDPRVQKMGKLLVEYCVAVKPNEKVLILGNSLVLPLVEATYREVIRAGGMPMVTIQDDFVQEILLKEGNDQQLDFVPEPIKLATETFDCRIGIRGAANTRFLSNVDPARMQKRQAAYKDLMEIHMKRSAAGDLRWVGTLFPTHAQAQEADMSLEEFEEFVYRACHLDKDDPAGEWRNMARRQQKIVDWLKGKQHLHAKGTNIDLTMSIADRVFINSDGRRNMPSGEIFTGPVEASVPLATI